MRNKVKSITEKLPQVTTMPDGFYSGTWSGYEIEVEFGSKKFQLETEEGVRGTNVRVVVEVKDGVATFDVLRS